MARYTNDGQPSWLPPDKRQTLSILKNAILTNWGCLSDPDAALDLINAFPLDPAYDVPSRDGVAEFSAPCTSVRSVWVGHATVVTDFPTSDPSKPFRVVFDPLFEKSCSPVGFPRRRVAVPFSVEDMKNVDAVVISHNHYDHLSKTSIKKIEALPGSSTKYFVPKGTKKWFSSRNISEERIFELDWWEGAKLGDADTGFSHLGPSVTRGDDAKASSDKEWAAETKANEVTLPALDKDGRVGDTVLLVQVDGEESNQQASIISNHYSDTDKISKIDSSDVHPSDKMSQVHDDGARTAFTITCTPAQHADGRDFLFRDKGHTRCATWVVDQHPRLDSSEKATGRSGTRLFFGGDTGYRSTPDGPVAEFVKEIQKRLGAMNLMILPAASGSLSSRANLPNALVRHMHAMPEDLVDMALILSDRSHPDGVDAKLDLDLNEGYSKESVTLAMHHSTFDSKPGAARTRRDLQIARARKDLSNEWEDGGVVMSQPGIWWDMVDLQAPSQGCP